MNNRYALVEDGAVVNIVLWDPTEWPDLYNNAVSLPHSNDVIDSIPENFVPEGNYVNVYTPDIGDTYNGNEFTCTRAIEANNGISAIYWKADGNLEIVA